MISSQTGKTKLTILISFLLFTCIHWGFSQSLLVIPEGFEPDSVFLVALDQNNDSVVLKQGLKLGQIEYRKRRFEEARYYLSNAKEAAKQLQNTSQQINCLKIMGVCYAIQSEYTLASENINEAISLSIQESDTINTTKLYYLQSKIHQEQGELEKAARYAYKTIDLAKAAGITKYHIDALNLLGNNFALQDKDSNALTLYLESKELATQITDTMRIGVSLSSLGIYYKRQKNYKKAIETQMASYRIAEARHDPAVMSKCLTNMGVAYTQLGNYDTAIILLNQSLELKAGLGAKKEIAITYNNLGIAHYRIENYSKAIYYLEKANQIAEEIGSINESRYSSEFLARSYESLGKYKQAYDYQVRYQQYHDSLLNIESQNSIQDLHVQYETEKKLAEIQRLELVNQLNVQKVKQANRATLFIIAMILLIGTIAIIAFVSYRRRKQTEVIQKQFIARENLRKDIAGELHDDICSDLVGIRMMYKNGTNIESELQTVYTKTRELTHKMKSPDYESLELNAFFQQIIHESGLDSATDVVYSSNYKGEWKNLNNGLKEILRKSCKETCTNIVKHAGAKHTRFTVEGNKTISVTIEDDGKGMPENNEMGMGIPGIKAAVESVGGKYSLQSTEKGSVVEIILP